MKLPFCLSRRGLDSLRPSDYPPKVVLNEKNVFNFSTVLQRNYTTKQLNPQLTPREELRKSYLQLQSNIHPLSLSARSKLFPTPERKLHDGIDQKPQGVNKV